MLHTFNIEFSIPSTITLSYLFYLILPSFDVVFAFDVFIVSNDNDNVIDHSTPIV